MHPSRPATFLYLRQNYLPLYRLEYIFYPRYPVLYMIRSMIGSSASTTSYIYLYLFFINRYSSSSLFLFKNLFIPSRIVTYISILKSDSSSSSIQRSIIHFNFYFFQLEEKPFAEVSFIVNYQSRKNKKKIE